MSRPFLKMNGLGNDFVVVEARSQPFAPSEAEARAIADRQTGVGCDQLIAIEPSPNADAFVRIWNADGGEVEQCGNAARCVGWLIMEAGGRDAAKLETPSGLVEVSRAGERCVTVDMGRPRLDWTDIPVMHTPGCVSMGNPHVVFFVKDAEAAPVREVGSMIEHHMLFPQRTNVEFAEVKARDRLRVRVWERGAGVTRACGTGACAALVAAARRKLCDRKATVEMDGGELLIEWRESDGHVLMTGPIEVEFAGTLP
jgi:diaminopimelate epimerase